MNTPIPPLPNSKPKTGLATTSLVLGILSMVLCGLFTAIPAIITGHIAHNRSRRSPAEFGGGGSAIAGFVLGYVSLFVTLIILPALLLPALARAKEKAESIRCVNNLKSVGIAARLWADNHDGRFPSTFVEFQGELGSPRLLWCLRDKAHKPASDWSDFTAADVSYVIVSPGANNQNPATVFARCPIHGHEVMVDGSVFQKPLPPIR